MKHASAERLEKLVDRLASVILGGAIGYLIYHLPAPVVFEPAIGAYATTAGLIAYWVSQKLLGLLGQHVEHLSHTGIALCDALTVQIPSPAMQSASQPGSVSIPLADSGIVVPIFDRATVAANALSTAPTDRVANDFSRAVNADASESLHQALDQLRRSLR